jgi:hypothetical protein
MKPMLSVMLSLLSLALIAQQATFTTVFWYPNASAQGYAITRTFDSNYLVAGQRDTQGLLVKMDPAGNILWAKKINIAGSSLSFTRIIPTRDSCFVAIGNTGGGDMICQKITAGGDTIWSKLIDMGFNDYAFSICQTYDGGFLIAGSGYQSAVPPYTQMAVVKLDSMGNREWSDRLTIGSSSVNAHSIRQTADSGSVVFGYSKDIASNSKATLIKLTPSGTVSWSKKLELSWTSVSSGWDVIVQNSGFLCYVSAPETGTVIIKTDLSGNVLWCRRFYAGSTMYGNPNIPTPTLQPLADGGIALVTAGPFGQMLKIDSTGSLVWSKSIFLDVVDMIESHDHGFLTVGNGPLMGVLLAGLFEPQIGIIKSDSLGTSVDCVEPGWDNSDTCTGNFIPVPVIATAAGSVSAIHPVIADAVLISRLGCVEMTGGTYDPARLQNGMVVFPNPAPGFFRLKLDRADTREFIYLEIYNSIGVRILRSSDPALFLSPIELPGQPDGIFLAMAVFQGKKYIQKILIRH